MDKKLLTSHIKNLSIENGFSKIGITPAAYYSEDTHYLNEWLGKKYNGSMRWMENRAKERTNIFSYYPEAISVIVFGINYFTGYAKKKENLGKISNYAWGDDYHIVIKRRLYKILDSIKQNDKSVDGIVCVDTSPVTEKVWAQRAGIGWIGKHTNLITREYSSWLFLGVIIINSELEYDLPYQDDLCGTCTACIDECPTNALVEPYILDSNKCISYITIEHRDEIDNSLTDGMDNWIYGCDICQQVCPWSQKFSVITEEESFKERDELKDRDLDSWNNLTEDQFKIIFKNSAVKRTKYSGFIRNVKLIKNSKDN